MSDEKDDNWEMPKPVFRTTSGALPKTFEETISQSFSPNKEENEIDYDDDILSLHDRPSINKAEEYSPVYDDQAITEMPDKPQHELDAVSAIAEDNAHPINVTSRAPSETTRDRDSRSDLLIYLVIVLIGAAIIIAMLFRS